MGIISLENCAMVKHKGSIPLFPVFRKLLKWLRGLVANQLGWKRCKGSIPLLSVNALEHFMCYVLKL